ncbi:hypothetical protein KY329_00210 [Candidatus Woesearchaeota archaeon]|nr:hypothetical protein [Candidatus Woesearchaeota archaeon]
MGDEIEKKYLIRENGIEYATPALLEISSVEELRRNVMRQGVLILQGYLPDWTELADIVGFDHSFHADEGRLRDKGGECYFGLKTKGALTRKQFELPIAPELFKHYWPQTEGQRVHKIRLELPYGAYTAEIDVYTDFPDLIVAEVEVPTEAEAEKLVPLGKDITGNRRYKNRSLAK